MTSKNYRLCNLVISKVNGISKIEQIGSSTNPEYIGGRSLDGDYWGNSFLPVELTEQWLIDFGFEKDKNGNYWIDLHTHYLELTPSNGHWYPTYVQVPEMSHEDEQRVSTNIIEFVHELQNLFFAITGKELEVKTEI